MVPCVWGRARDVRSLNREHAATGEPQDTETVLCGSGRGRWKRASNGTSPAAYVIALPHHRRCLIRLVHREPAPVAHRSPLLREVMLRWPRESKRDDALLAHSLPHQDGEAFTKLGAVNLEAFLDLPADHSASRVRGLAVRAGSAHWGRHATEEGGACLADTLLF